MLDTDLLKIYMIQLGHYYKSYIDDIPYYQEFIKPHIIDQLHKITTSIYFLIEGVIDNEQNDETINNDLIPSMDIYKQLMYHYSFIISLYLKYINEQSNIFQI
jgi:hypothetical protein